MSDPQNPLTLPDADIWEQPLVCISVNRDWIPIISGALQPMQSSQNWNYSTPEELRRIEVNNATLEAILVDAGACVSCIDYRNSPTNPNLVEVSCDGGETWRDAFYLNGSPTTTLTRYNDAGHREISTDGGDTWINDDENDPRFTTPVGETDETGNAACKAAENITNRAEEIASEIISILTETPTLVAIVFGISTFIVALIGFPVAIPFVVAFVAVIVSYTVEQIQDALDETAYETFKCIIVCAIENNPVGSQGRVTLVNWDEIVTQVRAQFTGIAALYFEMFLQVMGSSGLVILSRLGTATGESCDECDCSTFVFRLYGDEPTALGSYQINQGEYDSELNKVYGSVGAGTYDSGGHLIDMGVGICAETAFTMTRVIVYFHTVVNNPFTPRGSYISLLDAVGCIDTYEHLRELNTTYSGNYIMDTGLISRETRGVVVYLSSRSDGDTDDLVIVDRVEIYGEGTNPFDTA